MTAGSGRGPGADAGPAVRRVMLTITGRQTDPEGHTQETTGVCSAEYTGAEGGHLFRYEEGEGMTSLFVSRNLSVLSREGKGGTPMRFDPSVPQTDCMYATPYGTLPMQIRTRRIAVLDGGKNPDRKGELRIRARVQYELQMDAEYVLECEVTIRAQEV